MVLVRQFGLTKRVYQEFYSTPHDCCKDFPDTGIECFWDWLHWSSYLLFVSVAAKICLFRQPHILRVCVCSGDSYTCWCRSTTATTDADELWLWNEFFSLNPTLTPRNVLFMKVSLLCDHSSFDGRHWIVHDCHGHFHFLPIISLLHPPPHSNSWFEMICSRW